MRAPLLADKGVLSTQYTASSLVWPESRVQSSVHGSTHGERGRGRAAFVWGMGSFGSIEHGLILMTTKYRATDPLPPFSPPPSHTGSPQPEAAQPRGKSQEPHTMHPVPYMPIVDPVYMPIIDPIYMPIVDPVLPVVDATADPRLPCACR
jgi:hypothetical protein